MVELASFYFMALLKRNVDFHSRYFAFHGRDLSLLGPHDVDHACVTTGRRGFSMPSLLGLRGLKFPAFPIGVFVPSISISLEFN